VSDRTFAVDRASNQSKHLSLEAPMQSSSRFLVRGLLVILVMACRGTTPVDRFDVASPSPVRLLFRAESDSFTKAVEEYEGIWAREGTRIVRVMEAATGLRFHSDLYADTSISVIVREGVSSSGFRDSPMVMRASYSEATKRATLIHELGHRLQSGLFRREEEEHGPLFLWLYDVWTDLYGREFADSQVEVERRRRGPYPAAWDAAVALTREERTSRWRAMRDERVGRRR
jgi:hypothetical protein